MRTPRVAAAAATCGKDTAALGVPTWKTSSVSASSGPDRQNSSVRPPGTRIASIRIGAVWHEPRRACRSGPSRWAPMPERGVSWATFAAERPDLAQGGRDLLYQFGVGLGFLATVRRDGGPRVHPVCPILHDGELYLLLIPSPKRDDLLRDKRFALHSFPADDNEDAFSVTGTAEPVDDPALREAAIARFHRGAADAPHRSQRPGRAAAVRVPPRSLPPDADRWPRGSSAAPRDLELVRGLTDPSPRVDTCLPEPVYNHRDR